MDGCGWGAAVARALAGEDMADAYDDELQQRYGLTLKDVMAIAAKALADPEGEGPSPSDA